MTLYFVDYPLSTVGVVALASILVPAGVIADYRDICQRRVPAVLPVPDDRGRYRLALWRYVAVFTRHFRLAGVGVDQFSEGPVALLMPRKSNPMTGVLALALQEAAGRPPSLVIESRDAKQPVYVIEAHKLLEGVARWMGGKLPRPQRTQPA